MTEKEKITELESELETVKDEKYGLENTVDELKEINKGLISERTDLEEEVQTLKHENEELETETEGMWEKVNDAEDLVPEFKSLADSEKYDRLLSVYDTITDKELNQLIRS